MVRGGIKEQVGGEHAGAGADALQAEVAGRDLSRIAANAVVGYR
jgi:hypothetical protein